MDIAALSQLLLETAEHHGAYEAVAPPHDWWDWYAAYFDARQRGSSPEEASAAAGRYMAEVKRVVVEASGDAVAERECVGLGAGARRNVISSVRSRTVLAGERTSWYMRPSRSTPLPSGVDVHAVRGPGPDRRGARGSGIGARPPAESTRCASRAWNRQVMLPPACSSTTFSGSVAHSPASAQALKRSRRAAPR